MIINEENIREDELPATLENFSLLREKALRYIQQTSSANWTDHNIHDPGITIMEALCYALADLGFRLNFPMQDLIVDKQGELPGSSFYYAADILPCHPVTVNDFRKILIDLSLVKNAWITPVLTSVQGVKTDYEPLYVYKNEGRLILEKDLEELVIPASEKIVIRNTCAVFITGLYAVNIEFETDPFLGSIDSGESFEGIYEKDFFGDIYYDVNNWAQLINDRLALQKIANTYTVNSSDITLNILISSKNKYNNNDGQLDERVLSEWYYDIEILCSGVLVFTLEEVLFQPFFKKKKGIAGKDLKMLLTQNNFSFFTNLFERIHALALAYSEVFTALHQNRNLCEDFLPQVSAVPTMDFRICADVDVATGVDIEQVQAEIFYKIEEYLSPTITFYSFDEALAKGKAVEEILEGPKLTHGFVFEEEMGTHSFLNFTVNLSDIINAIYEITGLINCRNVQLTLTDDAGNKITNNNNWVIEVPGGYKPVLNKRRSKLLFFKNDLPLNANFKEAITKLSFLKTNSVKQVNSNVPLPLLNSTYRELSKHYAIANEFPATYKIGENFPDHFVSKPEFFASRQLEGYLLLFEQLIANFLTDLDQLKNTLSWKPLQHIQHSSLNNEWRRSYLLTKDVDTGWQNVVENADEFLKNRNDGLDYLLSRFAENLQELDNYFYLSADNLAISGADYYTSLVELKQRLLSNFVSLSANRGAAINVYANASYTATPISGYEDKISHLLGCSLTKDGTRKSVADIDNTDKNERGYFHVLEHILLRVPRLSEEMINLLTVEGVNTELLSICGDEDCTACDGADPYSFTASVVLPAWLKVYADIHYRDYIEKLIRLRTPVGVLLRICWIDEVSMTDYESKVAAWWAAKYALYHSDAGTYNENLLDLIKKQNQFILTVRAQRSEYFPATLHGCDDEGEENNTRVFLDRTFLGKPLK